MYLIVGLGNPGKKYDKTRHNVGFDAIDLLADYFAINIDKVKFNGVYGETRYKGEKIILLKPVTYMNASGDCLVQFANYFGVDEENIIVLVDDIDIEFGSVRIKRNGSPGTHNGLKSIVERLKTKNFPRVKIAVNQKPSYMNLADFVLSRFSDEERKIIDQEIEIARDAVIKIIENGIDQAMNEVNSVRLI